MSRAAFSVLIDGTEIAPLLTPHLISIRVSDRAGENSDSATIELDDRHGQIILPKPKAPISIYLGWIGTGIAEVFRGIVNEPRSRGSRGSGRGLTITASGIDQSGKVKEPQQRHFDEETLGDILRKAGERAGIDDVRVAEGFASIVRDYERMDDESFLAFGERIAREVGGTFKVSGSRALLVERNGGQSPSGALLPTIYATWGVNLHDWNITPYVGRPRFKQTRARYYDQDEAKWKEVRAEIELPDAEADGTSRFAEPDASLADQKTRSDKTASERRSGEGTITIEGNTDAQPEGSVVVAGTRPGIDGSYLIDGVDHSYSRSSGFTTRIPVKRPQGDAGKDER